MTLKAAPFTSAPASPAAENGPAEKSTCRTPRRAICSLLLPRCVWRERFKLIKRLETAADFLCVHVSACTEIYTNYPHGTEHGERVVSGF